MRRRALTVLALLALPLLPVALAVRRALDLLDELGNILLGPRC